MKIWLQFTWIEEYRLDFFLDGRLAFKGRIRSNPMINHDESCFDRIAIDSRCRGIVMNSRSSSKNCLIASRFDQKLSYKLKNIGFYKDILRENVGRPFRDEISTVRLRETSGSVAHNAVYVLL